MFIMWSAAMFFTSLLVCVTSDTMPCGDPSRPGDYYECHKMDPTKYYACTGGLAYLMSCPAGLHFDRASVSCLYRGDADCSYLAGTDGPACPAGHVGLLPHPDKCHWYIRCTAEGQVGRLGSPDRRYDECTYPQMFSILTHQCEDFLQVACYGREEVKEPCGYKLSGVPIQKAKSIPPFFFFFCIAAGPSCINHPNGLNPHPILTFVFIKCYEGRTMALYQCPIDGQIWNQAQMKCVDI